MPGAAARDELGGGVLDVERAAERRRLRGERLDLALGGVQPLAQRADVGLGLGRLALARS